MNNTSNARIRLLCDRRILSAAERIAGADDDISLVSSRLVEALDPADIAALDDGDETMIERAIERVEADRQRQIEQAATLPTWGA